jgi:cytochrome c
MFDITMAGFHRLTGLVCWIIAMGVLFSPPPGNAGVASDVIARLAGADINRGRELFRRCQACHTVARGAKNKIGPNLWSIVDRPLAGLGSFRYSKAMKAKGGVWSYAALDSFLTKPKGFVRGTRMTFAGMRKQADRADLIAYLRTMHDTPPALAGAGNTAGNSRVTPAVAGAGSGGDDWGGLPEAPGREATFTLCSACHSIRLVVQQGLSRADWDELFDWMIEEQEMEDQSPVTRATIVSYLATHYGIDRPNWKKK